MTKEEGKGGTRSVSGKNRVPRLHLIADEDDSEIEFAVANWAGVWDEWCENDGLTRNLRFIHDVVEKCGVPVSVRKKSWGGWYPGLSGVWYKVYTTDPNALKEAVKAKVAELLLAKG
jgi:hypothetical protein